MQFSATPYMKWGAIATLIGGMIALAPAATADDFTDTFSGTTLNTRWTQNIPLAGPEFDVNNGLSIVVPQGQAYDEWSTVDNAPRIEITAPTGDFAVSAKLKSLEDFDGNPLAGNFHSALSIGFSPTDQLFWGAYSSAQELMLERSGTNSIGTVAIANVPVWVEVVKLGQTFHFYYKMNDGDSWTELIDSAGHPVLITESKPVSTIGLMQKTWADVPGTAVWSSFGLSTTFSQFGSISGKITTNGPSATKVVVEALDSSGSVIGTATPASSGTYSIPVSPGTYTVKIVGNDNLSPTADSTKTGLVVTQGGNASADFTLQIAADLNTATDQTFEDKFTGTALNSVWLKEIPSADTSIAVNNGLTFSLPAGTYDWWTAANAAPKIQLPSPDGDFIATAKIKGTKDTTGADLSDNFQTTLFVRFTPYDIFHVGLDSTNKQVCVQRTGNVGGGAYETAVSGAPLWVQIRKVGTTYTFYYKINDTDTWTQLTDGTSPLVKTVLNSPIAVGLVTKSWGTTSDVNGTFSDFQLEAVKVRNYGAISGKVTTNGPSPAKASLEVTASDGTVLSTVPVASDGTYSATVGEGTVTVTLIGQAVDTTKAGYTQSGVVVEAGKTTTLNLSATYQPDLNSATDQIFEDKFPGTTLNPAWSFQTALAGPTVTVNNGLKIETPSSSLYDAWSTVGNAPRLALPAPVGDFILTGNLGQVVDDTGAAVDGANYHAALFVNYGGYDSFWWGAYQSNEKLQLERAGNGGIASTTDVTTPVWLQIKKIGNDYTFYYKQNSSDSWTQLVDANSNPLVETVTTSPVYVGITLKTWAAISAISPWTYFSLESPTLRFNGTLGGKITGANDPTVLTVNLVDASGASAGKSSVSADGVYSLTAISGDYTLEVIGADGSVVKSTSITVAPNTTTTQNIDLTASTVKLGDLNGDGKINVSDATVSLRIAVGLVTPTADQKTAGDVNKDGKLTVSDTTLILQVAVGLKSGF